MRVISEQSVVRVTGKARSDATDEWWPVLRVHVGGRRRGNGQVGPRTMPPRSQVRYAATVRRRSGRHPRPTKPRQALTVVKAGCCPPDPRPKSAGSQPKLDGIAYRPEQWIIGEPVRIPAA